MKSDGLLCLQVCTKWWWLVWAVASGGVLNVATSPSPPMWDIILKPNMSALKDTTVQSVVNIWKLGTAWTHTWVRNITGNKSLIYFGNKVLTFRVDWFHDDKTCWWSMAVQSVWYDIKVHHCEIPHRSLAYVTSCHISMPSVWKTIEHQTILQSTHESFSQI